MIQRIFGRSPRTTIFGIIMAVLLVIDQEQASGIESWKDLILPVAIAVFGRLTGDDRRITNRTRRN